MEKLEINIAQCIAKAFEKAGYEVELVGEYFMFVPLDIVFDGRIDQLEEGDNGLKTARLMIHIKHPTIFPNPVSEYVYGWGESYEIATIHAFERWLGSDFPVFRNWITGYQVKEQTTEIKTISNSIETNEEISWNGVIGPLLHFDGEKLFTDQEEQTKIFQTLFEDLTADLMGERGIYPIKCFMSKSAEGKIDIDCRLNGEEWEKGRQTLFNFCKEWQDGVYQYWKQYMVIYDLEDDFEDEDLKIGVWKEVNQFRQKKWWQLWKKGD